MKNTQVQNRLPEIAAFSQLHDLPGKIVQLAQALIFSERLANGRIRTVIVGDEPFLIGPPDADAPENRLHFFIGHGKLHPFAHQKALVVFTEVGNKGFKGAVPCI